MDLSSLGIDLSGKFEMESIMAFLGVYGVKLVTAVVIFFGGKWLARRVTHVMKAAMNRAHFDITLVRFLGNIVYAALLGLVCVIALSQIGIETASLAAVIAAAGLAVGLALQGSLSNFAAGVLLIIFRPFRAGDFIEAAGVSGTVEEITIFTTILNTPDNKRVIVPNSAVSGDAITNYSANETRRIDLVIGVGYGDNISKARDVMMEVLKREPRVLSSPEPVVAVSELGDSSVNFVVRPWVSRDDYWGARFAVTEAIKLALDENGISIPYPQRDLHIVDSVKIRTALEQDDAPKKTAAKK